jgi:hypothetical protein
MTSNITTDSIFNGKQQVTRDEVYKACEKKGINLYGFDAKLVNIEKINEIGECLLLMGIMLLLASITIAIVTACLVHGHASGVNVVRSILPVTSIAAFGCISGLILIAIASVKKRCRLQEPLNKEQMHQMFQDFKGKLEGRMDKMNAQNQELHALYDGIENM